MSLMQFFDDGNHDSRMQLKAVREYNDMLLEAFVPGRCECCRCKENNYFDYDYTYRHTFRVRGEKLKRRFAVYGKEEVQKLFKNSWKAFYKQELENQLNKKGELVLQKEQVQQFTRLFLIDRLEILLKELFDAKVKNNQYRIKGLLN